MDKTNEEWSNLRFSIIRKVRESGDGLTIQQIADLLGEDFFIIKREVNNLIELEELELMIEIPENIQIRRLVK